MLEYQHLVAGVSGGFAGTLVVHPLDLLRIRFAVNEGNAALRPQYGGYWQTAKHIYFARGISGLYQGVTPNLWGATLSWGFYFMFFNAIKDVMKQRLETQQLRARHSLIAGLAAGSVTLMFTNPIWVAKTRLCLQYETSQKRYHSLRHTLMTIFREEGLRGWYKGFIPGLFGTSHGALQFMAYDELKKFETQNLPAPLQNSIFSAGSKMFAVAATYPYQVVRSRLQDQHVVYNGIIDVISRTYRNEGLLGFYKGLLGSLLRVTPAASVTFVVYEEVNKFLRSKNG